jgi:hypothetical protein
VRVYGASGSSADAKALEKKRSAARKRGDPKPSPPLPGWPQGLDAAGVDKVVGALKCLRTLKLLQEPSPVHAEAGNAAATDAANRAAAARHADCSGSAAEGEGEAAVTGAGAAEEGAASTAAAASAEGSSKKAEKKAALFCDETVPTFFRRLSWTPDGAFLIAPTGMHTPADAEPGSKPGFATWLFRCLAIFDALTRAR